MRSYLEKELLAIAERGGRYYLAACREQIAGVQRAASPLPPLGGAGCASAQRFALGACGGRTFAVNYLRPPHVACTQLLDHAPEHMTDKFTAM